MTPMTANTIHSLLRYGLRVLAMLAALWLSGQKLHADPLPSGSAFPDLTQFDLEGKLPDLQGKVVLVDFWASWCGPCKKSFPVMSELQKTYGPKGLVVLAVSLDAKKSDMDAFLKKEKPPFAVVRDAKGALAEKVGVSAMPTSFLVGPDGRVIATHTGFAGEATRKKYIAEVEASIPTPDGK